MQLLVVFSLFLSAVLCVEENDSYNFGLITENDHPINLNTHYTPEVQAARDAHIEFQNYLRTVLPDQSEEEIPPLVIRHVPSPVKEEPIVPIIPVMPPQKVIRRQIQSLQHIHERLPQRTVQDVPANAQFGARSIRVEKFPAHIEVKVEETPVRYGSPRHVTFGQRGVTSPPLIRPSYEHREVQFGERLPQHVQQQQVQAVHVPVQEVSQYIQQQHHHQQQQQHHQQQHHHHQQLTAQDVQLVNGFTPEVAQATQEHLAHVAAIKAVLPNIET